MAFAECKGKTSDPGNFTFSVSLRLAICKTGLWLPTSRLVRRKGENLRERLIYNGTLRCITPGPPCILCVHAKSLQLCLSLCDAMDCSPPGSFVHGILQARILGGLPFLSRGDLPDPGIEPALLCLSALGSRFFTTSTTSEHFCLCPLK